MPTLQPRFSDPDCTLEVLDDNLYCITFHTSTRAAADAFIANLDWIYAQAVQTSMPFNCLIDGVEATVSISYLMRGVRGIVTRYPVRPHNKIAIVMNSNYTALVQTFLRFVPSPNPVCFFQAKASALAWLKV